MGTIRYAINVTSTARAITSGPRARRGVDGVLDRLIADARSLSTAG
jgi:hypothetical protein